MRRSTRQRPEVDYKSNHATVSTPAWLKARSKDQKPARGSDEENKQPSSKALKARVPGTKQGKDPDVGILKSAHKPERPKRKGSTARGMTRVQALKNQERKPLQEAKAKNAQEPAGKTTRAAKQNSHTRAKPEKGGVMDKASRDSDRTAGETKKGSTVVADARSAEQPTHPGSSMTARTRSQKRRLTEDTDTASDSDARSKPGKAGNKKTKEAKTAEPRPSQGDNAPQENTRPAKKSRKDSEKAATEKLASQPVSEAIAADTAQDAVDVVNAESRDSEAAAPEPVQNMVKKPSAVNNPRVRADSDERAAKSSKNPGKVIENAEVIADGSQAKNQKADKENAAVSLQTSSESSMATFLELQTEFEALQQKYEEIKSSHIADVENVITEVRAQEQSHTTKAIQLAAHWEAEAQRQAAIAQAGDVIHLQTQVEGFQQQVLQLQEALIDKETLVLERDEEIAALHKRLISLIHLVETYEETLPSPLGGGEELAKAPAGTPATTGSQRPAKLNQLREMLQEAQQPNGHLAHTPAQALKARFAQTVSASAKRFPSVVAGSRMASRLSVTQFQSDQPPSVISARILQSKTPAPPAVGPYLQGADTSMPQKAFTIQNVLGLGYDTAAGTPNPITEAQNRSPQMLAAVAETPENAEAIPKTIAGEAQAVSHAKTTGREVSGLQENAEGATEKQNEGGDLSPPFSAGDRQPQLVQSCQPGLLSEYETARKELLSVQKENEAPLTGRQLDFPGTRPEAHPAVSPLQPTSVQHKSQPQIDDETINGPEFQQLTHHQGPDKVEGHKSMGPEVSQRTNASGAEDSLAATSLGAMSDLTNKGLMNLVGLTITARQKQGGFAYSHPPTGFVFEIKEDDSGDEEDQTYFVFNPLEFGTAADLLPPYLKYEIKFTPDMRLKLVSRIMSHLGQSFA